MVIRIPFAKMHKQSYREIKMEDTTKKLALVVIFLSVVVVTLFVFAPAV